MSESWRLGVGRRVLVVAAITASAVAAAALVTARQPLVFRAYTTLLVAPDETVTEPGDTLDAIEALDRRSVMATLARLPASDQVRASAVERLVTPAGTDLGRYGVRGSVVPNTTVLRVEVEGPDPAVAASYANAIAERTRSEVRRTYRVYSLRQLEVAEPPRHASSPDVARALVVGGAAGLGLGVLVVFLLAGPRRALALAA